LDFLLSGFNKLSVRKEILLDASRFITNSKNHLNYVVKIKEIKNKYTKKENKKYCHFTFYARIGNGKYP
jgi:hypothetical protein